MKYCYLWRKMANNPL